MRGAFVVLTLLCCLLVGSSVSASVVFYDEFDGVLAPEWSILNEDPYRYEVHSDRIEVIATPGDLAVGFNDYQNLFLIDTPADDFVITMRVIIFSPAPSNFAQVDLVAYDDDDNHVRFPYGFIHGHRSTQFFWEVGGAHSDITTHAQDFGSDPFFMRLTKVGTEYRQAWSLDGVDWVETHPPLDYDDGTPAKVGFWVGVDPTLSSVAEIDYFKVETTAAVPMTGGVAAIVLGLGLFGAVVLLRGFS